MIRHLSRLTGFVRKSGVRRTRRWTRSLVQTGAASAICLLLTFGGPSEALAMCTGHPVTLVNVNPGFSYIQPQTWVGWPVNLWWYTIGRVDVTYRVESTFGYSCSIGVRFANPADQNTYGVSLQGDGNGGHWNNWGYIGSVSEGQTPTKPFFISAVRYASSPGGWVVLEFYEQKAENANAYDPATTRFLGNAFVWVYATP